MFHATRLRLVIQNALVLMCLFLLCGGSLYVYLEHRLMEQTDNSLRQTLVKSQIKMDGRGPFFPRPGGKAVDLRIVYLLWDAKGNLVHQVPEQAVEEDSTPLFQTALDKKDVATLSSSAHSYRVLTKSISPPAMLPSAVGPVPITHVQLVRNIDTEESLLSSLRLVLLIGGGLSALLAILASFYLAGRALIPIRQSWDKQQQFVADASHELRTPIAVIRSHTELLLRHPTHTIEAESPKVAVILKESLRMSRLLADLLTLARSDSNQLELHVQPLSVEKIAADVAEHFIPLADMKDIALHTKLPDALTIEADEERLRQLLVILLDNAIQYTEGPGTVTLSCRRVGTLAEWIVEDTGIGLAPDEVPLIFDRFYRGDKARHREQGGTGLGLSIAHWIVDAHHGKIRVESEQGVGTKMIVTLPLKKA